MNDNDAVSRRGPRLALVVPAPPPVPCAPMVSADPLEDGEEDSAPFAVEDAPESPYSALLRADLPDDLRTQALYGLWRGTFDGGCGGDEDGG